MTYHSQRPRCPSLSPHVLLVEIIGKFEELNSIGTDFDNS